MGGVGGWVVDYEVLDQKMVAGVNLKMAPNTEYLCLDDDTVKFISWSRENRDKVHL